MSEIIELSPWLLLLIGIASLLTSAIHGATGIAGGFLMAALLASLIGVKPVLPVMSIALLISHSSRALMNASQINMKAVGLIIIPAFPLMILSTIIYGKLQAHWLALFIGSLILLSIPFRRIAQHHKIKAGPKLMGAAGAGYGLLAGLAVGPGIMIVPFLLGYGLTRQAFVASLAMIAFLTNVTRTVTFGTQDLMQGETIMLGLFVGVLTIPGNWFGKRILKSLTDQSHAVLVDVLTAFAGLNFIWLAIW